MIRHRLKAASNWLAVALASLSFLVLSWISVSIARPFFRGGFWPEGRGWREVAVVTLVMLPPLVVAWLIARAIRYRQRGGWPIVIARALLPLAVAVGALALCDTYRLDHLASRPLEISAGERAYEKWLKLSDIYTCHPTNAAGERLHPNSSLRLVARHRRHALSLWSVQWHGLTAVDATSFSADTGSIGGSQGIAWREADGQRMVADLSFSDFYGPNGPKEIWVNIRRDGGELPVPNSPDPSGYANFTCIPTPDTPEHP